MVNLLENKNYLDLEELPTLDAETPIADAFRIINASHKRGFLLADEDSLSFVDAAVLAENSVMNPDAGIQSGSTDVRLGPLCRREVNRQAVVGLDTRIVDAEAEEATVTSALDKGVALVQIDANRVGLLFKEKGVLELGTRRIYFICENRHRNLDPGQGTCGHCPGRIVRTEVA